MDYCRAAEAASSQQKEISSHGPDTVIYLSKSKKGTPQSQLQSRAQPKLGRIIASSAKKEMTMRDCKYYGWRYKRKKEECPHLERPATRAGERTTSAMSANNKYSLVTKPPPTATCIRAS